MLALKPKAPALTRTQRMVLRVDGEQIADVEYRPDRADPGPFAQVGRMGAERLVATAAGFCPSCGVAHALAFCQAVESLAGVEIPERAAVLRVLVAELERAASHLTTVGALFDALGMPEPSRIFAHHSQTLREALHNLAGKPAGAWLLPGGINHDVALTALDVPATLARQTLTALFKLTDRLIGGRGLLARTVEVGGITTSAAEQFMLAGPLGRAAGLRADLRLDASYAAYKRLPPELVVQEGGDVYARMLVLMLEALESLKLVEEAANDPPSGAVSCPLPTKLPGGIGMSAVEAPRGPLRYRVEASDGRISAVTVQLAPQLDRLLARTLLTTSYVDDAALILLSTDPCDACLGAVHE
ncbi:hypothetical protein [Candidatus Viridilinea mediisalina]|uniref:NADH-quinone oxidoreductase subunit D domain-containing protein n=1 Tax=Candidatus Viridilinea mediisalina TaxID=2024553 RepID=A0A2A6RHV3_9CHLR|nr:hypothetical protein [Candidatus Viridilinea mediisalina]PDW02523.1 hypothetical protein CJ255_13475 [Candidatus Viridilinea mediisalina]